MKKPLSPTAAQFVTLVRPVRVHTVSDVARKLGVSRQTVTTWLDGEATPSRAHALALEDWLGLPARGWGPAPGEPGP